MILKVTRETIRFLAVEWRPRAGNNFSHFLKDIYIRKTNLTVLRVVYVPPILYHVVVVASKEFAVQICTTTG